jgi:hypothetical protein
MSLNGLLGFKGPTHLIPTHLTAVVISIEASNLQNRKGLCISLVSLMLVCLDLTKLLHGNHQSSPKWEREKGDKRRKKKDETDDASL